MRQEALHRYRKRGKKRLRPVGHPRASILLGARLLGTEQALTTTANILRLNPLAEGNEGESLHPRTYESA